MSKIYHLLLFPIYLLIYSCTPCTDEPLLPFSNAKEIDKRLIGEWRVSVGNEDINLWVIIKPSISVKKYSINFYDSAGVIGPRNFTGYLCRANDGSSVFVLKNDQNYFNYVKIRFLTKYSMKVSYLQDHFVSDFLQMNVEGLGTASNGEVLFRRNDKEIWNYLSSQVYNSKLYSDESILTKFN